MISSVGMKFGFRVPSFKKRVAARTSWKRVVRHNMGLKAPRGWGWVTNPKKAAYNRAYNRTTVGLGAGRRSPGAASEGALSSDGCGCVFLIFLGLVIIGAIDPFMRVVAFGLAGLVAVIAAVLTWRDAEPEESEDQTHGVDIGDDT